MSRLDRAIKGTARKLREVAGVVAKKLGRVRYCRMKQRRSHAKMDKHERLSRDPHLTGAQRKAHRRKADRFQRKLAYWHEQLDKAELGLKEFEARQRRLRRKLELLKKKREQQAPEGMVRPNRPWNPSGLSGPSWMVPWFDKAHQYAHFTVVSWFRTPEHCRELCQGICGQDRCPGTCAGETSNHCCPPSFRGVPFEGAADLSNYYAARAALARVGAPLTNHLPRDPVHVSHSGY